MKEYRCRGTITVFLSLISVLFLSLICTLVESARVQGARAWAAAVMDMGLFSVFSEYEKDIFETYDVFCLDGTYQTDGACPEQMAGRMSGFMEYNLNPAKGQTLDMGWNLFPMQLADCQVTGNMLATDEQGQAFYQQVVKNKKENLPAELLLKVQQNQEEARKEQESADAYEQQDSENQQQLEELEEQQRQAQEEQQRQENEEAQEMETGQQEIPVQEEKVENPLDEIKRIKSLGILGLVMKEEEAVSGKTVTLSELPSGRTLQTGTLPVKKTQTGITADGIFQEYLLDHFGNVCHPDEKGGLSYEMEYLLMGKDSDVENLKAVVHRLLLLREGINFTYLAGNSAMRAQAAALAAAIAGAAAVPGLAAALEWALLLAWAYGESLLDVRILLAGGKVAPVKSEASWKLSLQNLGKLTEVLQDCEKGEENGVDYVDYLRILLVVCGKEDYPLRALDLIESRQQAMGNPTRADHWVMKAEAEAVFHIQPVFFRVAQAFLGVSGGGSGYEVAGCYGYE